jgi:hypothetical protein
MTHSFPIAILDPNAVESTPVMGEMPVELDLIKGEVDRSNLRSPISYFQ